MTGRQKLSGFAGRRAEQGALLVQSAEERRKPCVCRRSAVAAVRRLKELGLVENHTRHSNPMQQEGRGEDDTR